MTTNDYLIAVIGDAKLNKGTKKYLLAENLGQNLIDNGYHLLTGVLDGITDAVSNGARHSLHYNKGDLVGILAGNDAKEASPLVNIWISTCLDLACNTIVSAADAVKNQIIISTYLVDVHERDMVLWMQYCPASSHGSVAFRQ